MKAIYLHGFNSDKTSQTITELRTEYPDLQAISYNYINPDKGHEQINNLIKETLKIDKDI